MAPKDNTADTTDPTWRAGLRREMLARRAALDPEAHAALSERIVRHLVAGPLALPPAIIGFCWPVNHEPDVRAAIGHCLAAGSRAALPVVIAPRKPLAFRAWTPATPLLPDRHGIPTPADGDWLIPDLLLLPLNAFDAAGYRIGYGGGYFDRTLASFSPRPLAVGVGFEIARVASIRPESHDQRLDWIVTEDGCQKVDDRMSWPGGA